MPLNQFGDPWPGTTYRGFSGAPASANPAGAPLPVRRRRSPRWLLAVGLTVVLALGVAGALWSYAVLESRAAGGGNLPARLAPSAPASSAQVGAATPPAEVVGSRTSAQLEAPQPEATKPKLQARREMLRARMTAEARRKASSATARANFTAAYAPESTLSAQAAAQAQRARD